MIPKDFKAGKAETLTLVNHHAGLDEAIEKRKTELGYNLSPRDAKHLRCLIKTEIAVRERAGDEVAADYALKRGWKSAGRVPSAAIAAE